MPDTETNIEALQAQIDLSMAFANDLVSSWMKGTDVSSSSARNVEAELKEYMRRPPRLGVGASVSEASMSTSREAARLKNHLSSKKRPRESDEQKPSTQATMDVDDESESRTSAINKKPRLDDQKKKLVIAPPATSITPNGEPSDKRRKKKKKKKAENSASPQEVTAHGPPQSVIPPRSEPAVEQGISQKKKKKRRHKKKHLVPLM